MLFMGNGVAISRRQQSIKGNYRKLTAKTVNEGDHKNITEPFGRTR